MKVLIVEDEQKVANFIKHALEEERYIVETAYDGIEAYNLMTSHHYDAVVLDVMLPGKDGLTLLREVRDAGLTTPIILLTARSTVEDKVAGLDLGADDYLPKPFSFDELAARLRSILRRSSPEKSTKLRTGDLVLDTVSHLAYRGGREIELTTKEYALLEYMMRNKNRILSRSSITQHVWKHSFDPESNIIDVYIKRLRSKLEKEGEKSLLQSIRGVGYRLREFANED